MEEIEYVIQVAVKAVGVKQAIEKVAEGEIISVNPRPKVQFGGNRPMLQPAKS